MKKNIIIGIVIGVLIIALFLLFFMEGNSRLVIQVGQKNGGFIDSTNPDVLMRIEYNVYSNHKVLIEKEYGGNNVKKENYKISKEKYDELINLIEHRNENEGLGRAWDYMGPRLRCFNENGEEESLNISEAYYDQIKTILKNN
ncbi:MAG: hypothetical protein IKR04_06955 [Clostridia bacterium]|nr:hypothetical protein [Clostridia bacterium]